MPHDYASIQDKLEDRAERPMALSDLDIIREAFDAWITEHGDDAEKPAWVCAARVTLAWHGYVRER